MRRRPFWAEGLLLLVLALACARSTASSEQGIDEGIDQACEPAQDAASFGVFLGASPLALRPLDLLRGPAAHLANPVLTPGQLGVAEIADPMLVPMGPRVDRLYLFFAALPCGAGARWGIQAAQSDDGGLSWEPLGWVAREAEVDLRHPFVFGHNEHWYLVPEVPSVEVGQVWLYRAAPQAFPAGWRFFRVAVDEPLRGVSIVRHAHRWWLIGSAPAHGRGLGGQDWVLRLLRSKSPLGPWEPHLGGSLAAEGARIMGKVFKYKNQLHRLGRTCRGGVCGPVEVHQMFVSEESFEQDTLQLSWGRRLWRQAAAWDSAGWAFLSPEKRNDGAYLAVMEARRLPPVAPQLPGQLEAAVAAFRCLALASIALLLTTAAARVPLLRRALAALPCGRPLLLWALRGSAAAAAARRRCKLEDATPPASPVAGGAALVHLVVEGPGDAPKAAFSSGLSVRARSSASNPGPRARSSDDAGTSNGATLGSPDRRAGRQTATPQRGVASRLSSLLAWLPTLLAAVLLAVALGGQWGAREAARVAQPFLEPAVPLPVQGTHSKFTLMVMSYDARLRELQWYVRHYSACPSVGEVLVVWNRGAPPDPAAAFESAVPVRVRVERRNSMNNRFRPDPRLKFSAVLSLDDDILLPCADVEAGFARWRSAPHQLVGWYPRLLLPAGAGVDGGGAGGQGLGQGPPTYRFEPAVFEQGGYNAILAGAAFMDAATLFPAYHSAAAAPARALVDEVFNCDDLLLNFVAANLTRARTSTATAATAAATARQRRALAAVEAAEAAEGSEEDEEMEADEQQQPQQQLEGEEEEDEDSVAEEEAAEEERQRRQRERLEAQRQAQAFQRQQQQWRQQLQQRQQAGAPSAADTAPGLPIQLLRPSRRLDLSRLSGVGISHDPARFQAAADRCLAEFSALFGGSPLVLRRLPPDYGPPPNCRWWPWLDCMYT